MTKTPEHIAWDSHWAHLQRAEAPGAALSRFSLRVHIVWCSPAASWPGLGPGFPARETGGTPPKDCPACPPGLAGRPTTYLGTFRPTALVRPAGRCSGFTRRAMCTSERLKTQQRYPWRARHSCAIEHTRTAPGATEPSGSGGSPGQAPGVGQRGGSDIPFRTTEIPPYEEDL